MSENFTKFENSFGNEEAALNRALENSGEISMELPFLKVTQSMFQEWIDFFKKHFEKPLKELGDWFENLIRSVFGEGQLDGLKGWDWNLIIEGFILTFFLIIVTFLILKVYRYLAAKDYDYFKDHKKKKSQVLSREEILLDRINNLLAEKNYSKASRIRWSLFLERKALDLQMTPFEFEQNRQNINLNSAKEQYERMFFQPQADREWFLKYNENLKGLEGEP